MDCTGKRIAFTGIAQNYTREGIHTTIKTRGGTLDAAVNSKTDLLVIGENPGNGTSKRKNAAKYGIPTMTAGEFMRASGPWKFASARPAKEKALPSKRSKAVTAAVRELGKQHANSPYVGF